jgi:hypothetical protein
VPLDAWQAEVVRAILRESGGAWSASQAGLVVGRQNGKGQILLALELAGLLLFGDQVLHAAHAVKTCSDAFRRLWRVIVSHADLFRLVRRHSQQVGLEYVELAEGQRVAFTTRSATAGRGLSIDRLVGRRGRGSASPGGRRASPDRVLPAQVAVRLGRDGAGSDA